MRVKTVFDSDFCVTRSVKFIESNMVWCYITLREERFIC